MNEERFENDKELNYIYEKLNSPKFRNYVFDYDNKDFYCDYIDLYECKIDDLKQSLNEIREYVLNEMIDVYQDNTFEAIQRDILQIIDKI